MPKMQGLYIHIPFCKSRCIYCGFFSTTKLDLRQQYVDALCQEMKMRCQGAENISTIYLGGGTPSQLTTDQLRQILHRAYIYNKVEKDAEVTIEVNPDDVTERFANDLTQLPVNRISMGVQTFDDKRLRFLHRRHTAEQVTTAVDRLRAAGIKNISIDLMYGFPGETIADCEADIAKALSLQVEHISTYCLMIEEDTQLQQMLQQGNITETEEELERQMYETIINRLEDGGYEQYELSNFARPGFHSRHNSSYWDGTPYIGIGAAAHSYDIESRSWNIADIKQYIQGMANSQRIYEEEHLDCDTRYNDAITVALRTSRGLDLQALSPKHRTYCLENAQRYLDDGLLERTQDNRLRLTRRGLFISDMIMSNLIYLP